MEDEKKADILDLDKGEDLMWCGKFLYKLKVKSNKVSVKWVKETLTDVLVLDII